ncbi:hypothetical protein ACJZ2D_006829 [Fusarium nematophilum]
MWPTGGCYPIPSHPPRRPVSIEFLVEIRFVKGNVGPPQWGGMRGDVSSKPKREFSRDECSGYAGGAAEWATSKAVVDFYDGAMQL